MSHPLCLLPTPRNLEFLEGTLSIPEQGLILLNGEAPPSLWFAAKTLQQHLTLNWNIIAGHTAAASATTIAFNVVPAGTRHPQGYQLLITAAGIEIVASTPVGIFYAVQTLIQILSQSGSTLPLLHINDWPDFPNRGVMFDISRDKVPSMETLFELIDMLASWKINQFQLYTEHTFAYQNHPEVWAAASPLTGEEILTLDAYCRERFIELVPNQNTFGHMRRWLIHERYNHLAECPTGCDTVWGYFDEPFTLCPEEPGSLDLVRSLMDELLPHFSSSQFNVGCDETVDLGQGRSKQAVTEQGAGQVYLDFVQKIYHEVKAQGRTMQFWGDVIITHPELIPTLPHDAIALEWGYEADHPFDDHGAKFAASGIPFYVCPGTASWNSVAGRTSNALANLRNAVENGLKHGAIGCLITDWGDRGHWQPLPVSYLGFAAGAGLAWAFKANREQDPVQLINYFVFQDESTILGQLAYDLGNIYQQVEPVPHNGSVLFHILQETVEDIAARPDLTEANLRATLASLETVMSPLSKSQSRRSDAELIQAEFQWAADMLHHACQRGIWALGKVNEAEDEPLRQHLAKDADRLIEKYREIWLARNRPGGLPDSQARLEKMRADYN